ncbi:MAG: right-handed parallel beta-helix repeat-containing protein [Hyphomicrobiales bacterium]
MISFPSIFRRSAAKELSVYDRKIVTVLPDPNNPSAENKINRIAARLSAKGGGTVILAAGVHTVSNPIVLEHNIRLKGIVSNGRPVSWVVLDDNADSFRGRSGIIRIKKSRPVKGDYKLSNVTVEDLFVDGNRKNQRQDVHDEEKKYGLYSESIDLTVRRVTIRNCMGYGFDPHGTAAKTPSINTTIEDCLSYGNLLDGFTLDNQFGLTFQRNQAYGNGRHGINACTGSSYCLFADNITRANKVTGMTVQHNKQNISRKIKIVENLIEENEGSGLYLRGVEKIDVERNTIRSNGEAGIQASGTEQVRIADNHLERNVRRIELKRGDVHIESYKGKIAKEATIVNNTIVSDQTDPVTILPECDKIEITSNRITNEGQS